MTFANYVIDRLAWLLLLCFALLLSVLGMLIARVALGVLILILGVVALVTVLVLVTDYLRIRSFYRELSDLSRSLSSQAYLCSTLTSSPHTREQAFVLSVMKTMTQAMVSQIEKTKQEQGDYRQYTELWVHEIKTPLAACELLLRNSDVSMQAGEMSLQAGECAPAGERAQAGEREQAGETPSQAGDFSFSASASVNQRLGLQIKRIEELVDQTLYYARSGNLENDFIIKNIQLDQVVKGAIHRYSRHMILAKVYPRLSNLNVNVRGDAKWVQFMIEQIISNAIKYRKPQAEASYIDISATQQTNDFGVKTTVLSIRDDGIGIPASDCSRVFEQSFTGENGRAYAKSTGIGLFLVDKLARKMNMSVRLSSQVGKGTTVCLCFSSALHDVM